ncbi:MAG TPA: alpha/beta hydrolase [Planctomycetota bacterium]|nr:alpha/beta hydrolase [Planctomycetota bacterium]
MNNLKNIEHNSLDGVIQHSTAAPFSRSPIGQLGASGRKPGRMSFVRHKLFKHFAYVALLLLSLLAALASAQTRTQDVIYLKSGGTAFTMDVYRPAKPNKAAVVFIISGGWISDHSMIKSFGAGIEKAFADEGFTVFSVVHGAQPRFKVAEIVEQVRTAVGFVHAHAADYGIDSNRIGVSGISSGGHLALMLAGSADCPVNAVAAIAPPTDLANWGKPGFILTEEPQMAMFIPALGFDPKGPKSELEAQAKKLSPISFVTAKFPATLIVHGDEDKIVPLQQAKAMDQALAKAGVPHKLEVISGGGHDEKTFEAGVVKSLQWFKDKLLK